MFYIFFKSLFYRHLPKTGSTRQREETGQVTECWPWSAPPLRSWLWAAGFWEQDVSGEPDLERPADVLPRWASIMAIILCRSPCRPVSDLCVSLCCSGVKIPARLHLLCALQSHFKCRSLFWPFSFPLFNQTSTSVLPLRALMVGRVWMK